MRRGEYSKALENFGYIVEEAKATGGGRLYHEFAYHDYGICWWLLGNITDAHEYLTLAKDYTKGTLQPPSPPLSHLSTINFYHI